MEPWLLGAIAGGTAALAMIVAQRRSDTTTSSSVLSLLQDRGPLTIPEMMDLLGLTGFSAQGKIVTALDTLVRSGRVAEQSVPPGTPTLDKIKVRKYALRPS